ncbi:hypothetical protein ACIRRA_37540 [Nocardia sp. NPDC101769]|uniref:hypothetical protein n=1 Tax=Nocardia sp. NPDC101769 TaxID=3364333 RepID=UPI003822FB62
MSAEMGPTTVTPTLVAVYELDGRDAWQRVAEFRLSETGTVELTVTEDPGCPLALHWYREGIETPAVLPPVTISDGPAFMRALLRPYRMNYCRLVDESAAETPHHSANA